MDSETIVEVLRKTSLLTALSDEGLADIAAKATERNYKAGEVIYKMGAPSDSMLVLLSGEVEVINDSAQDEIHIADIGAGQTIGEMGLLDDEPRAATIRATQDVRALELYDSVVRAFFKDASISLDAIKMVTHRLRDSNTELEKRFAELSAVHQRLEENYTSTVVALSNALEMRDKVTAGHSDRVAAYSLLIGKSMGLSEEAMSDLRLGALLHDLGKIGVSDTILHKKGTLTDEEWSKMREHPELGKQIIENIDFLSPAVDVVYGHHEKWAGGGYPRGIAGEDIPIGARIFALADVFDALSMERSYKKAWTLQDVLAEIQRSSGSHFDPTVVEHFNKQLDSILNVLERSKAGKSIRHYVSLQYYTT